MDKETQLVQTVDNTIIQNTSGPREADGFWNRAELTLLLALIHYVCNLKDERENLWGNIAIGLGNRLAIFQNPLVDKTLMFLTASVDLI